MELVLATLFGPILFFDFYLLPAFRLKHTPNSFSRWLHSHQHTSHWSQLFFSFTISLACCVRQFQESCALYEAATITQVVGVTVIGLSLTLTAYYQNIERMPVFVFLFLLTLALSAAAVIAPVSTLSKFDGLVQACGESSETRSLPWGKLFLEKYNQQAEFPELFSDVALVLVLNAIWCCLWLRRKHWIQGKNRVRSSPIKVILLSRLMHLAGRPGENLDPSNLNQSELFDLYTLAKSSLDVLSLRFISTQRAEDSLAAECRREHMGNRTNRRNACMGSVTC